MILSSVKGTLQGPRPITRNHLKSRYFNPQTVLCSAAELNNRNHIFLVILLKIIRKHYGGIFVDYGILYILESPHVSQLLLMR